VRFPDVHDGYDRLGMVHEARGEIRQAADCYRKVIAFIRQHPDGYDDVYSKFLSDVLYHNRNDTCSTPTGQLRVGSTSASTFAASSFRGVNLGVEQAKHRSSEVC
jgi:hypothetical protein